MKFLVNSDWLSPLSIYFCEERKNQVFYLGVCVCVCFACVCFITDFVSVFVYVFQRLKPGHVLCSSVGWVSNCKLKGCWFDSQSGPMLGLQVQAHVYWRQSIDVSLPLFFSSPPLCLLKKIKTRKVRFKSTLWLKRCSNTEIRVTKQ